MTAKRSLTIALATVLAVAGATGAAAFEPAVNGIEQIPDPVRGCALHGPIDQPTGRNRWTKQERWVWSRICIGKRADFGATLGSLGRLDPRKPYLWPENRTLRASFLDQVMREEPYRSALTHKDVTIIGARFREPIRIEHLEIDHELQLLGCRFDSDLSLHGSKSKSAISLDDSVIAGTLNLRRLQANVVFARRTLITDVKADAADFITDLSLIDAELAGRFEADGASVGSNLFLANGKLGQFVLTNTRIGNTLDLRGVRATKPLELRGTMVGGDLLLRDADLTSVDLNGTSVGNHVDLAGASVGNRLDLRAARIGKSLRARRTRVAELLLGDAVIGQDLDLTDATVLDVFAGKGVYVGRDLHLAKAHLPGVVLADGIAGARLSAAEATIGGDFDLSSAAIGDHVILRGAEIAGSVVARSAVVSGYFDVSAAELATLDLENADISGQLRLGWADGEAPSWRNGGLLVLTNAHVGELVDRIEAWASGLEYRMKGFRFERLGGGKGAPEVSIASRDIEWFATWLENEQGFSIDAYEQLAVALRASGRGRTANQILYRVRYGEVRRATGMAKIWKLAEWAIVGFGYRVWRAFAWIALFVGLGALFYGQSEPGKEESLAGRLSFSLDLLLPIPVLLEKHGKAALTGFPRYYFHAHRLAGFVIGLFIVAAMGGLIA